MKKTIKYLFLFTSFLLLLLFSTEIAAQCPMCKAAAESNLREGGTTGLGLNTGIIYLFLMPYSLVLSIGFLFWWKNRKQS